MSDTFNRWSQIVRRKGAVEIVAHHETSLPPIGGETETSPARAATRLLVRPLGGDDLPLDIYVTSTQVRAMLEGFLTTGNHVGLRFCWTSKGFGSKRKDTIRLRPLKLGE